MISAIWSLTPYSGFNMIKINNREVEYEEGMTVGRAYRNTCGKSKHECFASLDGELILRSLWDSTVIPDGAELVFIPIVSGG